ncbi:hypothetical protein LMH87_010632 [Akanthomyces muscarius]|uniref:Zn(2)-C6 fungal-type domain-containing protein n=1 Tax=Akanthomyces muscarius TaxID=2231603 RepID=A0A9W8QE55_AKAMU|nr:hypothetical protein LMH87_010632 [Akanthomyces muscarius]KAJ4154171.1 hypothetical protein LMH87_010632 [Akanthomyces muscarius]
MRPSPARTARCDNCRRKKIKCDNKLPRCTKCVMSNLDCQPFKKEFQFVFSGEVEHAGTSKRSQPEGSVSGSHTGGQHVVPSNPFVAPSIHRIAILDRALENRNLSTISVAVASSFCSSVTNDANLQAAGLKAYVKAVSDMRSKAVSFKQNWGQLLMASVTLFLYEFNVPSTMFYSTSTGMKSHILGITSILKLVGPAAFQVEPFHSMFLLARGILINRGIMQRKPPFVMEGDWLTIPWAKVSKTLVDKIMDCKGKLPTIWERVIEPCKVTNST